MYRMMIPVASHRLWFVYFCRCNSYPSREQKKDIRRAAVAFRLKDATLTPHGNRKAAPTLGSWSESPGCNSYPSREQKRKEAPRRKQTIPDATLTPHGNRKSSYTCASGSSGLKMQLLPLTGTENCGPVSPLSPENAKDATLTPHGNRKLCGL